MCFRCREAIPSYPHLSTANLFRVECDATSFVRTGVAAVGLGLISGERGAGFEAAFVICPQNEL